MAPSLSKNVWLLGHGDYNGIRTNKCHCVPQQSRQMSEA